MEVLTLTVSVTKDPIDCGTISLRVPLLCAMAQPEEPQPQPEPEPIIMAVPAKGDYLLDFLNNGKNNKGKGKGKRKAKLGTKELSKAELHRSSIANELLKSMFSLSIDLLDQLPIEEQQHDSASSSVEECSCACASVNVNVKQTDFDILCETSGPAEKDLFDDLIEEPDSFWLYDLAENWEWLLSNHKHGDRFVRSRQDKKKPKQTRRYVNARAHHRALAQRQYMSEHFQLRKQNNIIRCAKSISLSSYQHTQHSQQNQSNTPVGRHLRVLPQTVRDALVALQFKVDLTPEDYELLLRLDDTVAPKTLSRRTVNMFPKAIVAEKHIAQETVCMICMDQYQLGQELRRLPCGHDFHVACIDNWLLQSSDRCPLDNLTLTV